MTRGVVFREYLIVTETAILFLTNWFGKKQLTFPRHCWLGAETDAKWTWHHTQELWQQENSFPNNTKVWFQNCCYYKIKQKKSTDLTYKFNLLTQTAAWFTIYNLQLHDFSQATLVLNTLDRGVWERNLTPFQNTEEWLDLGFWYQKGISSFTLLCFPPPTLK